MSLSVPDTSKKLVQACGNETLWKTTTGFVTAI